jgi:hypothetical protein
MRRFKSVMRICTRQTDPRVPLYRNLATRAIEARGSVPQEIPLAVGVHNKIDVSRFKLDKAKAAATRPPDHPAEIGELSTFLLPDKVTGSQEDIALGNGLVDAWRRDGILQIAFPDGLRVLRNALKESKKYFARPQWQKAQNVDSQSFAGYIASGEEITDGVADYSEIFTVTKDLTLDDHRVQAKWVSCYELTL